MNQLVFIENDRVVTDSLNVARVFEKEHPKVKRDIRELECSTEFNTANFGCIEYRDSRGRQQEKFIITQDGFSFLVMGYTGKQAAIFKERYISEFNRMKNELQERSKPSYEIDNPVVRAERWIQEYKVRQQLEQTIEQNQPKVLFADTCLSSEDSILVRELAKLATDEGLNIGQNRLYQKLRDWRYIMKFSTEPTQRSMDLNYFEVIHRNIQTPEGTRTKPTTKVTPKGQMHIINRLRKELIPV